ncbi:MAG: chromate transporter [Clostridia bacterium]|nr:chromate transporter [Clostridia bacterium]
MIYLQLFLAFLKVGFFSFGGAYSAIPLIRDVVHQYGWLTDEELSYMIAVSESTPGPIMVNLATYVGSSQGGVLGAFIATLTVVLPAFLIILLVLVVLKNFLKNPFIKALLLGLQSCIIGVILATGGFMLIENLFPSEGINVKSGVIAIILSCIYFIPRKFVANKSGVGDAKDKGEKNVFKIRIRLKHLSPITLIVISAILGIVIYW